jgi:SAM-dependent methyltransferase
MHDDLSMSPKSAGASNAGAKDTAGSAYAERLIRLGGASWKRLIPVQAPYRWNLRRLRLGRTLDVGCGLGRNLAHLDGNGVGVDHNPQCVATARAAGLTAYTPAEFAASAEARPGTFDSMLVAHVLEHLPTAAADRLVTEYLPYLRPAGRVVLITPQERGFASDETHVRFVDDAELIQTAGRLGLAVERAYSFPFPRAVGRVFPYNEFMLLARRPG